MSDLRIFFSKTGRAKYISHLDLNRCFQRALKRSELPVWHTQGFNPHIYLTFSLPISLGFESLCEPCDLRLNEEIPYNEVKERLNRHLPSGLEVLQVAAPVHKHTEIVNARYEIIFQDNNGDKLISIIHQAMSQKQILVTKKSKKGTSEIDLCNFFEGYKLTALLGAVKMTIVLPAGVEKNINPSLLSDYLAEKTEKDPDSASIFRVALLLQNGEEFS